MVRVLQIVLMVTLVFFTPSAWLHATTPLTTPDTARPAQAALIFGAVVRGRTVSPLHQERLDAGIALLKREVVPILVVSNTLPAAEVMQDYLLQNGVAPGKVSMDTQAIRSPDTCAEAARRGLRDVLFVSQRFHLPRIALHCSRYGLTAQYVVADSETRPPAPFLVKLRVRGRRLIRETGLIWGTLLGVYPHQSPDG